MGVKWPIFLGSFFKKFIFYIVYKIMFWFKLRVHFGINIEVFFILGGMGGKKPYFSLNLKFSLFIRLGSKYWAKAPVRHICQLIDRQM